jgi:hypothetical protein
MECTMPLRMIRVLPFVRIFTMSSQFSSSPFLSFHSLILVQMTTTMQHYIVSLWTLRPFHYI